MKTLGLEVFGKSWDFGGFSVRSIVTTSFGEWMLGADTRQLFCKSNEVPLSPKALTLLQLLIESHPRALAKSDLHERLWPGIFGSDATLASLIP